MEATAPEHSGVRAREPEARRAQVGALEAERADRVRERAAAEGERRQLAALLQEAAQREALVRKRLLVQPCADIRPASVQRHGYRLQQLLLG